MPGWVIIAIGVSIFASAFTAWLLWQPWQGESAESFAESDPTNSKGIEK
jgi:hypothetical protein